MSDKNTVKVRIAGNEYTISGTESEQYIIDICSKTDAMIRAFSRGNDISVTDAAILCAINFCDEKEKNKESFQNIKSEIESLREELSKLRTQNKVLTEENNYIKDELRTTKKLLSERLR